ncbi:CRISPR-associated endonuclease Cas1 [Caldisericum sp.]|uniref:CRISPR-associated endonuclease Cas1 n=1 Tax=Caldisericum sp. TaxID=2499687 RepID=UPI003D0A7078
MFALLIIRFITGARLSRRWKSIIAILVSSVIGFASAFLSGQFDAGTILKSIAVIFSTRTHHPPKDPFNELLSFGYALLTNELFSILSGYGFDPYIGFYHELSYARPSLAIDLIEEFRVSIIDHLILNIVNLKIITETDFKEKDDAFFLNDSARKEFFTKYNKVINEFTKDIREQVQKMYHSNLEGINYELFIWRP